MRIAGHASGFGVGGRRVVRLLLMVFVAASGCGVPSHCGAEDEYGLINGGEGQPRTGPRTYRLPPQELQDSLMAILARPPLEIVVTTADQGVIETAFEHYPGAYHGILWWRRRWQRRTRYVFMVEPAWDDSIYSRLIWDVHTETRPNSSYDWKREHFVPDRFFEILAVFDRTLR